MRRCIVKALVSLLLLSAASLTFAGAAELPRLLVSHREMPGAWRATEVSTPLTVGPDGRIYFGTAGPKTNARFGCFDPATQQFEQLAELGAGVRVTAPVVFDQHGAAWLATAALPNDAGGQSARIISFSLAERAFGEAIELEGCSIVDFGIDAKRERLLVLAAQNLKGRFLRYDLKNAKWKEFDVMLVAGLCRMATLRDGGAVLVSGNDIYRYNSNKDTLAKSGGSLPTVPGSNAGHFGAGALVLGPDGKTVFGVTRSEDLLFSIDIKKGGVKILGPAFGRPAANEQRMALAVTDGKIYYAGYEKHQGQVGVFDLKTGQNLPASAMTSPAKVLTPMLSGSACVGNDKRVYLAGFGWAGCGLYVFPPLPEETPWSTTDRSYDCRHIPADAVTLDGQLNEPIWKELPTLDGFVTAGPDPQPATRASMAHVAWSDTHLYFAFYCSTGGFKTAGAERDDDIWNAESAELFACPQGADAPYYEIDANPDGVIYDSRVQSYSYLEMEKGYKIWAKSWDGMEAKTQIERDAGGQVTGWTLEAAIPFIAFGGGAPKAGDAWLFNVMRIAMSPEGAGEWSNWHSTNADFHRPHQFPKLKFVKG